MILTQDIPRVSAPDERADCPDGFQILQPAGEYGRVVAPYRERHPALLASRFGVLLSADPGRPATLRGLARVGRWSACALGRGRKPAYTGERCDALLFYSNRKPSFQPAIDLLAGRLAATGFRCATLSPTELDVWSPRASGPPAIEPVLPYYWSGQFKVARAAMPDLLVRSLRDTLFLRRLLQRRAPALHDSLSASFSGIWWELLQSHCRLDLAGHLLHALRPRLIVVTGEHQALGAELVLCPEARHAYVASLFNEHPTSAMLPVVADEVWVWNETVASELVALDPELDGRIQVTGKPEIDLAGEGPRALDEHEARVKAATAGRPVVVVLSEYDGNPVIDTGELTRELLRWVSEAARQCPDWVFLYKSRPFHHGELLPGREHAAGLANVLFPETEISLRQLLNWESTRAVAACGSTGLFVAAGAGKAALRLLVSRRSAALAVIDRVTRPIRSSAELASALRSVERNDGSEVGNLHAAEFPYRGSSLDRLASLCRTRLAFCGVSG